MNRSRFVLEALAAASIACTAVTDPEWVRAPGLVMSGEPPMTSLIAPDTVRLGQEFEITVSTFGSSTCTRADGYTLTLSASRADIVPFDLTAIAGGQRACTDDLKSFPRPILLMFTSPGQAEIQVEGRGFDEKPVRVSAIVTVLPE